VLTAVCAGQVGAVLALEASRLARNNRDWLHLIDLCAMAGTLVIDHDGVHDPGLLNDRLLLGTRLEKAAVASPQLTPEQREQLLTLGDDLERLILICPPSTEQFALSILDDVIYCVCPTTRRPRCFVIQKSDWRSLKIHCYCAH